MREKNHGEVQETRFDEDAIIDIILDDIWDNAIKGAPLHSLAEILPLKTVEELKQMVRLSGMQRYSKLKKAELANALIQILPMEDMVRVKLSTLSLPEWQFFHEVWAQEVCVRMAFINEYIHIQTSGLLQSFFLPQEISFVVPTEIKKAYAALAEKGIIADIEKKVLLKEYAMAAVRLYGIIPIDAFLAIYNAQNDDNIDESELMEKLEYYTTEKCPAFLFYKNNLIYPDLEEDDFEDVEELEKDIEGKPRYIPEKEIFLQYADDFFFERTEQVVQMEQFFQEDIGLSVPDTMRLTSELVQTSAFEMPFSEQFHEVEDEISGFKSDKQANHFAELLADLKNNCRLWANKGHTPNEMISLLGRPKPGSVRRESPKISRNAPCPCGSGKKYKNCCGKNS